MLWAIYITLIIIGLFCNNSKVYDVCVVLFMGLLAWLNTQAADYALVYLPTYQSPFDIYDMDIGWSFLCQLGRLCGLYYNGFACIVTVASMLLYRWFGKKIGANTSFLLSLFLVYPGLISIVQFRQFVACSVGLAAVCLFCSKSKWRYLWFALLMVVAISLHRTAIVLLFVTLVPILVSSSRRGRAVVILSLLVFALLIFLNWQSICVAVFGGMRTAVYLSASSGTTAVSTFGGIRNVLLVLLMAVCPYLCFRYMASLNGKPRKSLFEWAANPIIVCAVFLNLILVVLVPVVVLTNDFMRFERYGFAMALGLFAIMPSLKKRSRLLSCKAFYLAVCLIFAYTYICNSFDTVYVPLLSFTSLPPFFG